MSAGSQVVSVVCNIVSILHIMSSHSYCEYSWKYCVATLDICQLNCIRLKVLCHSVMLYHVGQYSFSNKTHILLFLTCTVLAVNSLEEKHQIEGSRFQQPFVLRVNIAS